MTQPDRSLPLNSGREPLVGGARRTGARRGAQARRSARRSVHGVVSLAVAASSGLAVDEADCWPARPGDAVNRPGRLASPARPRRRLESRAAGRSATADADALRWARHAVLRRPPPLRARRRRIRRHARRGHGLLRPPDGVALRELQRRHLADPAAAPAGVRRASTPSADGPTTWATRSATAPASRELLAWWRGELRAMYEGEARHPVMVALAETVERVRHPDRAVRGPDLGLRAGPGRHRLRHLRPAPRLLHPLGDPVGHLVLYLGRAFDAGERPALGLHLHGPATRELLAGRGPRPGHRPRLPAARGPRAVRLSG